MCGVERSKVRPRGLQTECNIATAAYISHPGFSPLQCPAAQAMLATSGFPCVTRDRETAGFFSACSFPPSVSGKNTVGVVHGTLDFRILVVKECNSHV